ncbi:bacteriohemerythrin [Marinilabilia rubra]|uniref:Hemerythrin n=1 Tax=Marinilabilia rubra TaxID=2162893 RepID=A0A2U2BDT1_9BACT|nr:bacteriohemerythrin [Marinilabilia rubra]PWE01219.1 hemerythrin [Marinilabilia rubra]
MIEWTTEFSVENPKIDDEHKELFKLLDDFYQGLQNGSSKEELGNLIKGLLDYANFHFSNEEDYMKSIGFPNLEKHKKEHKEFIGKATDFYDKHTSGKLILSLEVTNFIKKWITNHIKSEDKQYAAYVAS